MKILYSALIVLFSTLETHAQAVNLNELQQSTSDNLLAPTPYAVTRRDANSRVWERTTYEKLPSGGIVPTKHSYTELATGMHYRDAQGQWVESKEEIEACAQGAIARHGPYQVTFAHNLNSAWAIDLQTRAEKRLRSNILGLGYYDRSTGQSVLIAQIQNSNGKLISSNQVLYPQAFSGVAADVRYTYRKSGFEQDVILREQPPRPEVYGLNPSTTELEVMTEFVDAPAPKVTRHAAGKDVPVDEDLNFGGMRMVRGKAFELGEEKSPAGVAVHKQYLTIKGRKILVEAVSLSAAKGSLAKLPPSANDKVIPLRLASNQRTLPETPLAQAFTQPLELAQTASGEKGYVLDYVAFEGDAYYGDDPLIFQSDTTYLISGEVHGGGDVIVEGGAVIKYDESGCLDVGRHLICKTTPYHPAVFTCKDDDSVGETIEGSTGTPTREGKHMGFAYEDPTVKNIRFCHATLSLYCSESGISSVEISDCQFVDCGIGIYQWTVCPLNLHNVLFAKCDYACDMGLSYTINAEQVTADVTYFVPQNYSAHTLNLTNCIIVGTVNEDLTVNAYDTAINPGGTLFQTVGAASYYLTNDSPYRDIGTPNISPATLADIGTKTTYPPTLHTCSEIISTVTTFGLDALRDTDTPDLGYHYDPLDHIFGGAPASASFSFAPGTAVGWFQPTNSWCGIFLSNNVQATFNGTLDSPCIFTRQDTVQEGNDSCNNKRNDYAGLVSANSDTNAPPQVSAIYTHFYGLSDDPNYCWNFGSYHPLLVQATHSEFWNGSMGGWGYLKTSLTNCLFVRPEQLGDLATNGASFSMCNCTLLGGTLLLYNGGATWPVSIANCAFDGTTTYLSGGNSNVTHCDYNAFLAGGTRLVPRGSHDVTNLPGFYWQTGPRGDFYAPSGSPLINHGSTNADRVGLSDFTTQTNQVKETNSTIDIGYHYLGTELCEFWLGVPKVYSGYAFKITSPLTATGVVTVPSFGFTNAFALSGGTVTNLSLPWDLMMNYYDVIETNGIHVTVSQPASIYLTSYSHYTSYCYTGYPMLLLGTNYCVLSRYANDSYESGSSVFAIVATASNTTVNIAPSQMAHLSHHYLNVPYTLTMQPGETYQERGGDTTGTWITSDKPIAVFAGADIGFVPAESSFAGNPWIQEQLPVESWGTNALALSYGGRVKGDTFRVLAAYTNTVITITGKVVTVLNEFVQPHTFTTSNETVVVTNNAGEAYDVIISGPAVFQASKPVQVAQFANGAYFEYTTNSVGEPTEEGDPNYVLVPPTGHYLNSYTVATPGDPFDQSYLNIIVSQSATNQTTLDGVLVAVTNYVAIGTNGYFGAQLPVTNGTHTVSSSQPVEVRAYGWGTFDSYGFFGGVTK